jgi:hypothetical protein
VDFSLFEYAVEVSINQNNENGIYMTNDVGQFRSLEASWGGVQLLFRLVKVRVYESTREQAVKGTVVWPGYECRTAELV